MIKVDLRHELSSGDRVYRIGADIGGTFTDCAILDEKGEITIGKARTTPPDFERGVIDAQERGYP